MFLGKDGKPYDTAAKAAEIASDFIAWRSSVVDQLRSRVRDDSRAIKATDELDELCPTVEIGENILSLSFGDFCVWQDQSDSSEDLNWEWCFARWQEMLIAYQLACRYDINAKFVA